MKYFFTTLLAFISFSLHAQCEYYEDFETYSNTNIPTGWNFINTTGNAYATANVQTIATAPSPSKYFSIYNSSALSGNLIAVLPIKPNLSDGNHRITFYMSRPSGSATLQVGTIDTPDSNGTFSMISNITPTTAWTKYYINIPAGTNQYVALRHTFGSSGNYIRIDNICIEQIPSCLEVSGITATSATSNSLSFNWTASSSNENKWEYLALPTSSAAPTASTSGTEVNTNSATANNLSSDTDYNIYVRAKCSGTNFGAWIGPILATTACGIYTAGFTSGFEDNVATTQVKPCWTAYDTGTGDLNTYATSYSITPFGNLMLRFYFLSSTAANSLVLISPEFSDLSNTKQIRFKMNKRAGFEANIHFEIGTVASPTDMSTFTSFDTTSLTQSTIVADLWTEFTIPLTNYNPALGHHYIAFRPKYDSGTATQYIFMDDFVYETNANLATSENNNIKTGFTLYPNPAKSELNIISETPILKVNIYNMEGKKILTVEEKDVKKINTTSLNTGNYILQAVDNKGTTKNSKFIKQ